MSVADQLEFFKSVEEMVVCSQSRRRYEPTHRKRIDHRVIYALVSKSLAGRHFPVFASRRSGGRRGRRGRDAKRSPIHAHVIFSGLLNPSLRVNRPAQMIVKV